MRGKEAHGGTTDGVSRIQPHVRKENDEMKRLMLVLAVLVLAAGLLSAGPGTETSTTAAGTPKARTLGGLKLPLSATLATLRIASGDNWYTPTYCWRNCDDSGTRLRSEACTAFSPCAATKE